MHALLLIAAIVVAVPDRPSPNPEPRPKTVQESLLGEWKLVNAVIGTGEKDPGAGKETVMRFTPTMIHVMENGTAKPRDDVSYTLDLAKMPIAIDLTTKNGPMERIEGIIRVDGDRMVLCFAFGGKGARPTEFTAAPNTMNAVLTFARLPKK